MIANGCKKKTRARPRIPPGRVPRKKVEIDISKIVFVGWIPGRPWWYRRRLRKLGVDGPMKYSFRNILYGHGVFEHCEATDEVMKRLVADGLLNPGSFVGIHVDTREQVPYEYQKWWHYGKAKASW